MKCQNCEAPAPLIAIETFQSPEIVYRTRKCQSCKWKFTTLETFADEQTIPAQIRKPSRYDAAGVRIREAK